MLRPVPPKEMFGNNGTIESKIWADVMKEEVRAHDLAVRAHPSAKSFVSDHRQRTALRHSHQPQWFQDRDPMTINCSRTVEELFNEEVRCFVKSIRPTNGDHALRYFVIGIVRQRCVDVFGPSVMVNPFGSTVTKLYLPDSDIDLEVRVPAAYTRNVRPIDAIKKCLSDLRLALARDHQLTRECSLVTNARVPILKLLTTSSFGSFAIDICVNQPKGPSGAVMCMATLEILPASDRLRVTALLLLFKTWLRRHRFHEVRDGGLGGLSAFCMVLHYVQMDPWTDEAAEDPQMRLGSDWIGFVRYYGEEFKYDDWCISILGNGTVYPKDLLFQPLQPKQFRISIQHPVELKRDLASGSFRIEVIRDAINDMYLDLIEYLDQPLNLLQQRYRRLLEQVGIDLPASTALMRSSNVALIQDLVARHLLTVPEDEPVNPLAHPREGLSWTIATQLHIKALRQINDEDERRLDAEEHKAYQEGSYRDAKQDLVVYMDQLSMNGGHPLPTATGTTSNEPIILSDTHRMPRLQARLLKQAQVAQRAANWNVRYVDKQPHYP